MQIDFHHATTYTVARCAGFEHEEADIIGYAAQYVDNATNEGTIKFDNGAMYNRLASAHKIIDHDNFDNFSNQNVWLPFHFLPGNSGKRAGENPDEDFYHKIICQPNSYVAHDLLDACLATKDKPYGLHKLGIAMHVYADTWAHQKFAGIINELNKVELTDVNLRDKLTSAGINSALPLGHGAALTLPDRPYLSWEYNNSTGQVVSRNNTDLFLDAAENMCRFMQKFRNVEQTGLLDSDKTKIENLFTSLDTDDEEERHSEWIKYLKTDGFSFGTESIAYTAKGVGSWKYQAIGTDKLEDSRGDIFTYSPDFLSSDWKMFHDALILHKFEVIHDILPKYGICAS